MSGGAMRCAVCAVDSERVKRQFTAGGEDFGSACPGECAGLLWEAHYNRATGANEDEHGLVVWKWKRRRADVEGRVFLEPMPLDAGDQRDLAIRARFGVGAP